MRYAVGEKRGGEEGGQKKIKELLKDEQQNPRSLRLVEGEKGNCHVTTQPRARFKIKLNRKGGSRFFFLHIYIIVIYKY